MLNEYKFLVCKDCNHHISHTFNVVRVEKDNLKCSCCGGDYETITEKVKRCPRCGDNASFQDCVSNRSVSCSCGITMTDYEFDGTDGRTLIHKWNERPLFN